MEKVSVIIPNYNHAKYLSKRVESVLNQTYSNIEVLLLDDCSTDNSLEVLSKYASLDKRVRVIENKVNSGSTFKQWKKGLEFCSADLVWIAESDDYASEDFLTTLVPLLLKNKEVGLAYSNSMKVEGLEVLTAQWSEWKDATFKTTRWSNDYINSGIEEIANYLMYDCTINNTSAVLFKKQYLVEVVDQIQDFRYAGDWFAFINICFKTNIAYVSQGLNFFRSHTENVSIEAVTSGKIFLERFKCMSSALRQLYGYDKQKNKLLRQLTEEFKYFLLIQVNSAAINKIAKIRSAMTFMFRYDTSLSVRIVQTILRDKLFGSKK